jgi:basic amino acid/polyamine antiporter, APA family
MANPLWAKMPMDQIAAESRDSKLKRSLGPWHLTALGIGCTIGTGIFVLTGVQAAVHAGPAIVVSFIIAGIGCLFAGLCYAEFASMVPLAGSAYTYSYATLGEFAAWFIGWDLMLEYGVAASTVAVGWGRYLTSWLEDLGLPALPASLTTAPLATPDGHHIVASGAILDLPAMFIVALTAFICYIGIKQSAWFNNIIVIIKVTIVIAIIGFGCFYIDTHNWVPFIPQNTGTWGDFGWSGIMRASAVIFFAYVGFDAVSTAAQEAKNPQRDVSFGIMAGLLICTLLYILMSGVLTGLLPYTQLNDAAPVAVALRAHPQLHWLSHWVIPGALLGLTSVILVLVLGQARIMLALSRDGLLPRGLGAVHPRFRTPHVATVITGVFALGMAGVFPIGVLSELVSIGTLLAFVMVCIGVLVLRHTRPELPRPFRLRWPWVTCTLGVLFCGAMMGFLDGGTWLRLVIWTIIGVTIYYFYGRHHSRLRAGSPVSAAGS